MKDLEQRQLELLTHIVQEYIRSSHPVGSLYLAEHLPFSPATIRNAMVLLEEAGYMIQPHTSAGRVPTPAAYRIYIQYIRPAPTRKVQRDALEEAWGQDRVAFQQRVKKLARIVATSSGEIVFTAFDPATVITTGIRNLSEKPEFENKLVVADISTFVDGLDEYIHTLFERAGDGPTVLVGGDEGIPETCSVIVTKYAAGRYRGVIGIVGPLRMQYERNISLLRAMKETIEASTTQ